MAAMAPPPLRLRQFSCGSDRFLLSARLQMASLCTYDHLLHAFHGSSSPIHWRVTSSSTSAIDRLLHALHFSYSFDRFLLGARLQMTSFRTSDHLLRDLHGSSFPIKCNSALAHHPPSIGKSPPPAPAPSIASSMLHTSLAAPIASFSEPAYKLPPSASLITSSVPFMARRSPSKRNSALARHPPSIGESPPPAPALSIASSMLRTSPAALMASFSVPACKCPPSAPPITSFVPFMARCSPIKRNSASACCPPSIGKSPPSAPAPSIASSILRTSPAAPTASFLVPIYK